MRGLQVGRDRRFRSSRAGRLEFGVSLAGPGNVSGLEKFFQRFSAEARDHLRIGYAFDAPEFLETKEARAVAHERGPVEVENHFAFLGAQGGLGKGRLGVALEELAICGDGEAVEETVEPQRPGAGGEVEEIGALEFLDAFELRVQSRSFASFRRLCGLARLTACLARGTRFSRRRLRVWFLEQRHRHRGGHRQVVVLVDFFHARR